MSKKDEVFALLDQGKTVDSPEVKAVGLQPAGLKAYVKMWAKARGAAVAVEETPPPEPELQPEIAPKPRQIKLHNLPVKGFFTKDDRRYRVATKSPETIICHLMILHHGGMAEGGTVWKVNKVISLSPDTVVFPDVMPTDVVEQEDEGTTVRVLIL